jgi:hypothetical protein
VGRRVIFPVGRNRGGAGMGGGREGAAGWSGYVLALALAVQIRCR